MSTTILQPSEPVLRLFYIMSVLLSAWGGDAGSHNGRSRAIKLQARSSSQGSRRINLADNQELHDRAWRCTKGNESPQARRVRPRDSKQDPLLFAGTVPRLVGWAASETKALRHHLICSLSEERASSQPHFILLLWVRHWVLHSSSISAHLWAGIQLCCSHMLQKK